MAMTFPILNFDQANPMLAGLMRGNQVMQGFRQNQAARMENQNLPDKLKAALMNQQLLNQLNQGKLKYQDQDIQSTIGLRDAQAEQARAMAEFGKVLPGAAGQAQALGIIEQKYGKNSSQYELAKQLIDLQMRTDEANIGYKNAIGEYLPSKATTSFMNLSPVQQLATQDPRLMSNVGSAAQNVAAQAAGGGMGQQMQPQLGAQPSPEAAQPPMLSPEFVEKMQRAQKDALARKLTPEKIMQQRYFAATADTLYDKGTKQIPSVEHFTGAKGQLRAMFNKYGTKYAGKDAPQDYQDYMAFTTQTIPLFANELRRKLGSQATDNETKILMEAVNPNENFILDPKAVEYLWNQLGDINDRADRVLIESPSELQEGLEQRVGQQGQPQAQPQMQAQPISIPTFKDRDQFLSWFNKLSPDEKRAVRQQMGGK